MPRLSPEDIVAELAARKALARAPRDFLDPAFQLQSDFIRDPARLKAAFCTRRSGKSYGAGLYLFKEAIENPGCTCLYIGLTRDEARRIMLKDILRVIDRKFQLGTVWNETSLSATLPNGSVIYLLGIDSSDKEREKLLGQKYKLVIIDEAASYSVDLEQVIFKVLRPAMADLAGTIAMLGTPGNIIHGVFYETTKGLQGSTVGVHRRNGWSVHCWPATENPYMRDRFLADIEDLKKTRGEDIVATNWFRQMYRGEWCVDTAALVYAYQESKNSFQTLPATKRSWNHVLGVDLGWADHTAFALTAYQEPGPGSDSRMYVLETESESGLDFTAVANKIRGYQARFDIDTVVIDGANRQGVEEMRRRGGLPLTIADKRDKYSFQQLMNDSFRQGLIRLHAQDAASLASEYAQLVWDERQLVRGIHSEAAKCSNHIADACLYAWRHTYSYLAEAALAKHQLGTPEWAAAEEEKMLQSALQHSNNSSREGEPGWGSLNPGFTWD
jgi:hypothetical protein